MKKFKVLSALIAIIISIVIFEECKPGNIVPSQSDGIIRGYVYADVLNDKQKNELIYIPDVKVTVKDDKGVVVDEVLTKPDGNYATKHLKKGKYQLCLSKTGFIVACYDVTVNYASNHPGPLKIGIENYLWGSVKQKDGSAGFYNQQVFNVHIDTKVAANINGIPTSTVRCNVSGYYVLPVSSYREKGTITAICQKSQVSAALNTQRHIDMTLPNSDPKITSIVAYNETGKTLLRSYPGKKIKLVAGVKDAENNTLHYQWIPFGKFPSFVSNDGPEVSWELPATKGTYEMDLMVTDSFGGATYKSYSIVAGDGLVSFSGTVINMDGSGPIPNALIKVNGKYTTSTDVKGTFNLKVPENDNERYVLNVVKPGYALCSKIYMNSVYQEVYKLVTTSTQTFSPSNDITITERPDKTTSFNGDDKRVPAGLFIPKNSIVDSSGHLVTVPVNVSIRSIDVTKANGQMPGNFGGAKEGKNVRLESFGAVDVQIRDNTNPNIKYKLAETAKAELSVPIPSSKLSTAANSISFWDYNDSTGLWDNIGTAKKVGNFYKGITNRFSVLNADLEFVSGTYIVLLDNPLNSVFTHRLAPGQPISISVATVVGSTVTQGHHILNNLEPADVINGIPVVNLPALTHIRVTINSGSSTIRTLDFNSGPVIPGSAQLPPPNPLPPYDLTAVQKEMFDDDQSQLNVFLSVEENPHGSSDADNYYTYIGAYNYTTSANPTPHNMTFAEWLDKNGYNDNSVPEVKSVYFNAGDLGFWRGMHQKTYNGFTSFYVSNFGNDADAVANNVFNNNAHPELAKTVCMEFSPVTSGINITKFYVFNANGDLVNSANLDNNNNGPDNGQKYVPGLCITCHGGASLSYTGNPDISSPASLQQYFEGGGSTTPHPNDIPNFLPFDVQSFLFTNLIGDQEANLKLLNNTVLQVESPSTIHRSKAIIDFINAAYTGGSPTFIPNSTVGDWNSTTPVNGVTPQQLYTQVIGTSCRTCHVARTDPALWWDTQAKFASSPHTSSIEAYACPISTSQQYMPNSKVTYLNFWNSVLPNRPQEIRTFLNSDASCQ